MQTKKNVPPKTAIAKFDKPSLARSEQILNAGLKALADYVSQPLAVPDMAATFRAVKDAAEVIEDLEANLKERLVADIQKDGGVTTEKGSMQLAVGDWKLEIRPHRTGLDEKKVEALLRAKNLDPANYMDSVIVFKLNPDKLADAPVTEDELDTCKYSTKYILQTPKKL